MGAANGGGISMGLPAQFTNVEPTPENQEGEGGAHAPGSLPAGPCSCQVDSPTILSFLILAATSFPSPQAWEQRRCLCTWAGALYCPNIPFTTLQKALE